MNYEIYRGTTLIATIKPTGTQKRAVMGQDTINASFTLGEFIQFAIGDTLTAFGKTYVINQYPQVEKVSSLQYNYTATFEALGYDLAKVQYMFLDDSGSPEMSDFPLTADAGRFIDLIVSNMNRAESGWSKGTVDATDYATLSFSGDSCLSALSKIAQQFQTEFWIDDKIINLTKEGQETTLSFSYGKGQGLYSIQSAVSNDKDVFSRLYVFGSTKNIPAGYRSGKTRLQIGDTPYIQKTAQFNNYGLIEATQIFDGSNNTKEIYPHRTGTISAVTDAFTFSDSGMDFDLNAQLISGVEATLHFQTGQLAGYEFTISSYNATTKTFVINQNKDETGLVLPDSAGLKPAVGDTYVLLNISMPASYVTAAETALLAAGNDYYDTNADGRTIYTVECDPIYFKGQNLDTLNLGDFVTIADTPMGIDKSIRMIGIERDLQLTFKYTLTLADTASVAEIVRQYFEQQNNQIIIQRNKLNDVNRARRNWRNTADLEDMVFDPEGDYYTDKIKPASIETLYLAVGAKAQNFSLNGVVIQPNFGGDQNRIDISSGQLVHYSLEVPGVGSVWQMDSNSFPGLDANTSYYLFAKISTTALTGVWELLTAPVQVDSETGYYRLGVGVLFAAKDGYRDFEFNKGMTYIVGDTIKTGKIQSIDAQNYFDLTQGKFNLGSATSGLDWDVSKADTLTIRGGLVVNPGGASEPLGVFRGAYDSTATYYQGDTLTYDGSTWKIVSATPVTGIEPTLTATQYQLYAHAGKNAPRIIYTTGDDLYISPTLDLSNSDTQGWKLYMAGTDLAKILATDGNEVLVTDTGIQIVTSTELSYVWASTEILDANGNFASWGEPTRITGRPGDPGSYVEYRYKKNGSTSIAPPLSDADRTNPEPDGWTIAKPSVSPAEYVWYITCTKSGLGIMTTPWSDPAPTTGTPGPAGPWMNFMGVYNPDTTYHGGADYIQAVYYNGYYYIARYDAGDIKGIPPTDATKWNPFGAQFTSVATGLLLAQTAYINNLGVRFLSTADSGQRIVIDGDNDNLIFYDNKGREVFRIDGNIDAGQAGNPLGGAKATDPEDGSVTYNTGNGLFSNAGGMQFLSAATGLSTNASIVGLLFDKNKQPNGIAAAVVGLDATSGDGESWGGYFNSIKVTGKAEIPGLMAGGLSLGVKIIDANYTLTESDTAIMCYNIASGISIDLPANPTSTRILWIKRVNTGSVTVRGNGKNIRGYSANFANASISQPGHFGMFIWDTQNWQFAEI